MSFAADVVTSKGDDSARVTFNSGVMLDVLVEGLLRAFVFLSSCIVDLLLNTCFAAVASTFESVPSDFWESCGTFPSRLMYAVGVVHGVLRARQMFGAVGLSQSYPIDGSTYVHAIESLMAALPASDNASSNTQFICEMLTSVSPKLQVTGQSAVLLVIVFCCCRVCTATSW